MGMRTKLDYLDLLVNKLTKPTRQIFGCEACIFATGLHTCDEIEFLNAIGRSDELKDVSGILNIGIGEENASSTK